MVAIQVSAFLHDYGGGCVLLLLIFRLGTPGVSGIFIIPPYPPLIPSEGPYVPSPSTASSNSYS